MTAIGTVVFFAGYVGMLVIGGDGYWGLWFIGLVTVMLGSGLFAAVTFRTRVLSRLGAALIGIGILVFLGGGLAQIELADPGRDGLRRARLADARHPGRSPGSADDGRSSRLTWGVSHDHVDRRRRDPIAAPTRCLCLTGPPNVENP